MVRPVSASPCQRGAEDVAAAPNVCARCRHSYSRQPSAYWPLASSASARFQCACAKSGAARSACRNAAMASGNSIRGLQRQSQIVPRRREIGLERECLSKLRDGLVGPVRGGERQAQIVVEFRLLGDERDGALEQRQRVAETVALIVDHAQVMQRGRVVRRRRRAPRDSRARRLATSPR